MSLADLDTYTATRTLALAGEVSEYAGDGDPAARLNALWDGLDERNTHTESGGRANLTRAWLRVADLVDGAGDPKEPTRGATLARHPDRTKPQVWRVERADQVGALWLLYLVEGQR